MPIQPKTSNILPNFAKNWQLPYGSPTSPGPRAIQLRPRHPAQPADALPAGEAPDGAALRLHTINILVLRLHVIFSSLFFGEPSDEPSGDSPESVSRYFQMFDIVYLV